MVIKKLNSLFHKHSRVLFGIFTVIIIIAFMDFLTPGRTGGCSGSNSYKIGTAFGKNVTSSDLQELARDYSVLQMFSGQRGGNLDTRDLFNLYCQLKRAEQMGICVSDKEVADTVKMIFRKDGKFDLDLYNEFLKNTGIKDSDVMAALKIELTRGKLISTVTSGVIVTDAEVESFYKETFPRFAIRVLEVRSEDFLKTVKDGSKADLEKYFRANEKKYIAPGSFTALIVNLPYDNVKAEAAKLVKTEEVNKIAAENDGKIPGKDGKKLAGAELKKFVREALVKNASEELARKQIDEFARTVYAMMEKCKTPAEKIAVFRKAASDKKLVIIESGKVSFDAPAAGKIYAPRMLRELQTMPLAALPVTRISESGDGVCIGCLVSRTEPRQQKFEEVAAKVQQDYRHAKAVNAARRSAHADAARIAKAKNKSAEFGKCRGKISNLSFNPDSLPQDKPEQMELLSYAAPALQTLCTGEFSKAIETPNGALIVEAVKRSPADMSKFGERKVMIKARLLEMKRNQAAMTLFRSLGTECHYDLADQRPEK